MIVTTKQLIKKLKEIEPEGVEVSIRFGILTTTKVLYLRNKLVYLFLLEYDWDFNEENGNSISDFKKKYAKWHWKIDQIIS